ncbi:MAG: hypothetical protein NTY51_08565 [Deltaproteobacteria bacterium]|nr:hypothetical protein [Deltaproteobacteria bacterium]
MLSNNKNGSVGRKLFYIPIVHTETDMGALSESVKKASLQKMGLQDWKRKKQIIGRFWNDIEKAINNLNLPYSRTKIYQDGLPVCEGGKELEIVNQLASTGSRNHELLDKLIRKGATLMGSESPDLLVMEYNLAMNTFNNPTSSLKGEDMKIQSAEILKKRDEFIAKRINDTLKDGEVGVLLIGLLHNVVPLLDVDIEVVTPIAPNTAS